MRTGLWAALLPVLVQPPGARASDPPPAGAERYRAEVQRLASPLIDAGIAPGLVVGIYDDGQTEVYGLGVRSPTDQHAPDGDTLFEIGSVSKVFTCLLLADAVTQKQVSLDEPLSHLLPARIKPPMRDGVEITLAHLATHSSGLPRIPGNLKDTTLKNPYASYGAADLFAFLDGFRPTTAPGEHYEYSNLGVGLLGQLLADRAGKSYADLLRERITTPLAMKDTTISLTEAQSKRLAPPYRDGVPVENWTFDALVGCGGVRSSVNDMLKLVAAHLHPEGSPLAEAAKLAMTRRPVQASSGAPMGLGWHYAADNVTLWHTGQTGGYSAAVFIAPPNRKGVVILANGASSSVDQLAERIIQSLFGMKVDPPSVRKPITVSEADLERLVGEYDSSLGFMISVTRRGDVLYAQVTGQEALRVFPESPTRFFYRAVEAELEFTMDEASGKAARVTLYQNGRTMPCVRR